MAIEKVGPIYSVQYHSQEYQRKKEFWERLRRVAEEQKKKHKQPLASDNGRKRCQGHFDERA